MTTEHTPDWLDNETWEPEQVAEMVRRYRAHADLLAALEAVVQMQNDETGENDFCECDSGHELAGTICRSCWAIGVAMRAIDKARGIGQNIDTRA